MTVQIPYELYIDLLKYHCFDCVDADRSARIKDALEAKLDSMVKRELYTKSKTAATAEEREAARRKYLDKIGMPADYRY